MKSKENLAWRVITASKYDHLAHLVKEPIGYGEKALCGESVDPFPKNTYYVQTCYACEQEALRIAEENS